MEEADRELMTPPRSSCGTSVCGVSDAEALCVYVFSYTRFIANSVSMRHGSG